MGWWAGTLLIVTASLQAQTTAPSVSSGTASVDLSKATIAFLTAATVFFIGKVPWVPRPLLPVLTPVLGVLYGLLGHGLVSMDLSWFDSALSGSAGVFSREVVNQTITKQIKKDPELSKTNAFPVDGAVAVDARPDSSHPREII